jgi:hypothetical protein
VFITYFFPKNNTSLRQNYFENFEGLREVTHVRFHLVFVLVFIWLGTWLGESVAEKVERKHVFRASDVATVAGVWRQMRL